MVRVSVVIPCFNHGQYIREAIKSVEAYPDPSVYELIIVNDGSTDAHTLEVMQALEREGYRVINQPNQGLGAARNNGIRVAAGEYILPLDSDNRIRPAYIQKGLEILDQFPKIGIVHGQAQGFEGDVRVLPSIPFELTQLLEYNPIDACAVFRKAVWEQVGGYDEKMPVMGYEDWDLWLSAHAKGWQFCYVEEILFDYRVRANSMLSHAKQPLNHQKLMQYLYIKHASLVVEAYQQVMQRNNDLARKYVYHRDAYQELKTNTGGLLMRAGKNIFNRILPGRT
jgi:glycosyltransferase involved in cell wall biosynthesis